MLSSASNKRIRFMIGIHLIWLFMVCLLGAWWGTLVLRQAQRIAELENHLGVAANLAQSHWHSTQRMLFWESATFFALLLACTVLLGWLYYLDLQRSRSIHAFFASVTHELRTPLTSIRLQAESIAEGLSKDDAREKNLVRRLLEDTMRLEGQVERTLELARIEGGGPVYLQPLQIKSWMDRFLMSWAADYHERVELEIHIEDLFIDADPMALQIIFKNILENSVKHSKREKVKISISSYSENEGLSLIVKDDGEGFLGKFTHLGTLFQKGASSQGTGVGLYLAKALMKRMNGSIRFQNHRAEGNLALQTGVDRSGFEMLLWFPVRRASESS